ncbi:hypothetical protein [Bacillus subtilis]|uniref:hypothetical protein n=1 Tax=Bacillus subtilis TaxID=1423 RepID=UPI001BDB9B24
MAMIGMLLITGGFGLLAVFAHHLPLIGAIMLAMATEAGNAFVMMPSVTAGANALPNELVADGNCGYNDGSSVIRFCRCHVRHSVVG